MLIWDTGRVTNSRIQTMLSVSPFGHHGLSEDWPERGFINPDITGGNMLTANQIGSSGEKTHNSKTNTHLQK